MGVWKRTVAAILVMTLALSMAGCRKKEPEIVATMEQITEATEIQTEAAEAQTEPAMPQTEAQTQPPKSQTETAEESRTENAETETAAPVADMPILEEINKITRVGTVGAFMTALESGAKLLDWAANTGLDPAEIEAATAHFLDQLSQTDRDSFVKKLEKVDDACRQLMDSGAGKLIAMLGEEFEVSQWGEDALEALEAVMRGAGLR